MCAALPPAIPGAGAGAAAIWPAYSPTRINLKKHPFRCILNMDRMLKWLMEHPDDVMPMDMCIRLIVSDWFGKYILAMIDEYVRRIDTPANRIDTLSKISSVHVST